jgi:hypothetical protein
LPGAFTPRSWPIDGQYKAQCSSFNALCSSFKAHEKRIQSLFIARRRNNGAQGMAGYQRCAKKRCAKEKRIGV